MRNFLSLEARAQRESSAVARLQILRRGHRRQLKRRAFLLRGCRVGAAVAVLLSGNQMGRSKQVVPAVRPAKAAPPSPAPRAIWTVEQTAERTLYSNGLSVRRDNETTGAPRRYHVYRRDTLARSGETFHVPAGIVFHTTESELAPMEAGQNTALLRRREDVLQHVRKNRSYNFVIDRFGQVSRIVPEEETALHAGHSIWASGDAVWVDLNESFLGVSFEAKSGPKSAEEALQPTAAQVHSGRLLTEMLRFRFGIPEANCVTHAQVSVNPDNMRAGYHTDWGGSFPFAAIGLTGGYSLPVASVAVFGFGYDDLFLRAMGGTAWPGLLAAGEALAGEAAREGLTPRRYRELLQQHYKNLRRQRND